MKYKKSNLFPPPKYYSLMCDKEKAKKLSSTTSIFDRKLKERNGIIREYWANVEKLNLSRTEVIAACDSSDSRKGKTCSESIKVINVSTIATDPEGDVFTL